MTNLIFRAWDKENKKMQDMENPTYSLPPGLDRDIADLSWFLWTLEEHDEDGHPDGGAKEGKYILMQYTDLNDKNGKKIYEGDIVTYSMLGFDDEIKKEYNNQFRGFIVYSDCQFKIQYSQSELSKSFHYLNMAQNIKVVGNKWENPKLIKLK